MPAIAAGAKTNEAQFYWHLGDFRAIYDFDQDIVGRADAPAHLSITDYQKLAWSDFIERQVSPFGGTRVVLTIGNHELVEPKTRGEYIAQFADWLDTPALRDQRLHDDPADHRLKPYFHWVERGVDFIALDNASPDQFDDGQLAWFKKVMARDAADPRINTLVVGMHEALPDSISRDHSMSDFGQGERSGRQVYAALLEAQNTAHKRVYVLSSHSHYFMDGIFNTDYWRGHGGVLPGWIVGTAGAVRYVLPSGAAQARAAKTHVYGYLVGSVQASGAIEFAFHELGLADLQKAARGDTPSALVEDCFRNNPKP